MKKSLTIFKIKKVMLVLLAFLFLLLIFTSIQTNKITKAECGSMEGPDENGIYYNVSINEARVEYVPSTITSLHLPDTFNGNPVVGYETYLAFRDAKNLKYFSASTDAIGSTMFEAAFQFTPSLESITLTQTANPSKYYTEDGILYMTEDGKRVLGAYPAKKYARSFELPEDTYKIGWWAFSNNYYLEEITLPSGLAVINSRPFGQCKSLKKINVPEDNQFFSSLDGLLVSKDKKTLLYYPANKPFDYDLITDYNQRITALGPYAFDGHLTLEYMYTFNFLTSIGGGVFENCKNLTNMDFVSNLTTIPWRMLLGCESLTSVKLPNTLQKIQGAAFQGTGLTHIEIPASVTTLEYLHGGVFQDCADLNSITFLSDTPISLSPLTFQNSGIENNDNAKIFVPQSAVSAYKASWSTLSSKIFANPQDYGTFNLEHGGILNGYLGINASSVMVVEPTRKGYDFTGWIIDGVSKSQFILDVSTPVAFQADATWNIITYDISYNLNGGTNHPENPSTYTRWTIANLKNPTKEGYIFTGWSGANLIGEDNFFVDLYPEVGIKEYTAHWAPDTNTSYTVNYYVEKLTNSTEYDFRDTETLYGTTDASVTLGNYLNKFEGFSFYAADSTINGIVGVGANALTLKAYYKRKTYKVTWGVDYSATPFKEDNLKYGYSVSTPAPGPSKDATVSHTFSFSHWDRDIPATMPTYDVYIEAVFNSTPIPFPVEFRDWNNTLLHSYDAVYGESAIPPAVSPTREGYRFIGWDKSFDNITATPYTVIAQYAPIQYTIKFNSNGGSNVLDITQNYESNITIPTNVTKTGYTFDNWYTDETLTTVFNLTKMPLNGAILYAKWEPKTTIPYVIEYYLQNINDDNYSLNSTDGSNFGTTGTQVFAVNYIDKYKGFSFNEASSTISDIIKGDGSLTLEIYYTRNKYSITFDSNGGSEVIRIEEKYDTTISEPTNPTKEGYTFGGWFTDDGTFEDSFTFSKMPLNGKVLYAKWTAKPNTHYEIHYYLQNLDGNGYFIEVGDTTKSGMTDTLVLVENHIGKFAGFSYNDGLSTTSGIIKGDGSLVLTVFYDRNEYSIVFDSNGGSGVNPIEGKYDIDITEPNDPIKEGYDFEGWHIDNNFSALYEFSKMPLNGKTLYAKWKAKTNIAYKIEYYQQNIGDNNFGLVGSEEKTGTTGNIITLEDYTNKFNGFTYTPQNSVVSGKITGDGLLTLKVYYIRNLCTITFLNGNEEHNVQIKKYGDAIVIPANPTKPASNEFSYSFKSWGLGVPNIATEDLVLSAEYQSIKNKFIVTFKNKDGGNISTVDVEYGMNASAPRAPEVAGYTFVKWDTDITNIRKDIVVTTVYRLNEYTISFDSNGAGDIAPVVEKYTNKIVLPEAPTKEGFKFLGWYNGDEQVKNGDILLTPENIELTAKWEEFSADSGREGEIINPNDSEIPVSTTNNKWIWLAAVLGILGGAALVAVIYGLIKVVNKKK